MLQVWVAFQNCRWKECVHIWQARGNCLGPPLWAFQVTYPFWSHTAYAHGRWYAVHGSKAASPDVR